MTPDALPPHGFSSLRRPQQTHELRAAGERERREAMQRKRLHEQVRAIGEFRPGAERPGQNELRRPDFLGAALKGVGTPEVAQGALAALRDAGRVP